MKENKLKLFDKELHLAYKLGHLFNQKAIVSIDKQGNSVLLYIKGY